MSGTTKRHVKNRKYQFFVARMSLQRVVYNVLLLLLLLPLLMTGS
jgi:hypothetical protein